MVQVFEVLRPEREDVAFNFIGNEKEISDRTRISSLVHVDCDVKIDRRCSIEGIVYIPLFMVMVSDGYADSVGQGWKMCICPYKWLKHSH